jgi:4a-hydroxytetrahydrobiopterin dehydratase
MVSLLEENCASLKAQVTLLTDKEKEELRAGVPDWRLAAVASEGNALERDFAFTDYVEALGFVREVGLLAEEQDHHPVMTVEPGHVVVRWSTHGIGDVHRNDFIMAAKTDAIYGGRLIGGRA